MTKKPEGQYRIEAVGIIPTRAFVQDSAIGSFVSEADYRAKGYEPDFDSLPLEGKPSS